MSTTDLIDLTMSQADYFDGASPIIYTQQWDRLSWNESSSELPVFFVENEGNFIRWSQQIPGGQSNHWVSITNDTPTGSLGAVQIPEDLYMRLWCHVITNLMPAEALPEVGETLGDLYRFYTDRQLSQGRLPALPYLADSDLELLEPTMRPAFAFSEE